MQTPNSNANPAVNGEDKCRIDYFIVGPEKHVDTTTSAEITKAVIFLQALGVVKLPLHYRSREV